MSLFENELQLRPSRFEPAVDPCKISFFDSQLDIETIMRI